MSDSDPGIDRPVTRFDAPASDVGTPLYRQVKEAVLLSLSRGEWKQGEVIPPEKALAQRYGVSIGTLRKAIDELVAGRLLLRHQGRGTFVAVHAHNSDYFRFFNLVRLDGQRSYPRPKLVRFNAARANATQRQQLGLAAGAQVFEFTHAISLNDEVVSVDDIVLPEALFRGLNREQLLQRPSTLYHFYQEAFGINVVTTDERLAATVANGAHARWLGVEPGLPVLEIRRVAFTYRAQPVEWRISHVHTKNYQYLARQAE